jgi:urate oxidase
MGFLWISLRAAISGQVSEATVTIVERPWDRVTVDGKPHSHGEKDYPLSY